jgi:hypothetical protein
VGTCECVENSNMRQRFVGWVRTPCAFERARKSHNHTHTRSERLREGVDRSVHRQDHGDSCVQRYMCTDKEQTQK